MSIVTWEFESPPLHLFCGNSSVGRAQPCQGWGREFESRFPLKIFFFLPPAEIAQLVEHNLAKVGVASSSLVFRSKAESLQLSYLVQSSKD